MEGWLRASQSLPRWNLKGVLSQRRTCGPRWEGQTACLAGHKPARGVGVGVVEDAEAGPCGRVGI